MKNITETIGGRFVKSDISHFLWAIASTPEKDLPTIKIDGEEYSIKCSYSGYSIELKKK